MALCSRLCDIGQSRWISSASSAADHRSTSSPSKFPQMETLMTPWLEKMTKLNRPITDSSIRMKAREVAHSLHIDHSQFKASSGWVDNFKRRHNIRKGVYRGARTDEETMRAHHRGLPRSQPTADTLHSDELTDLRMAELSESSSSHGPSRIGSERVASRQPGEDEDSKPASSNSSRGPCDEIPPQRASLRQPREAFDAIFSWIAAQGPGFATAEEQDVLTGLMQRGAD